MPLRVVIVADVRLFRDGLAELLARQPGIEIVARARSNDALGLDLDELTPDVVLWDVATQSGIDGICVFAAAAPDLSVLVLSIPEMEREIVRFAEAGMAGYVTRDADIDELVRSIRGVANGEALCSPRIAGTLLRRVGALAQRERGSAALRLTPRELQIVGLVRNGLSNKEIATELTVELSTVKNHVHNVLEKLGVHHRAEAAAQLAPELPPWPQVQARPSGSAGTPRGRGN